MSTAQEKISVLMHDGCISQYEFGTKDTVAMRTFVKDLKAEGHEQYVAADLLGRTPSRVGEVENDTGAWGFKPDTFRTFSATVCSLMGGPTTAYTREDRRLVRVARHLHPWAGIVRGEAFSRLVDYMALGTDDAVPEEPTPIDFSTALEDAVSTALRIVNRPTWPERIMKHVELWAESSTCSKLATAAVIVDPDWQVLVSGFNGAPRGLPHCTPETRNEDRNGHCLTCVHAEDNCVLQAARVGISLKGGQMFTLHRPCVRCSTRLAQLGLASLTYRHDYNTDGSSAEALAVLGAAGVEVRQEGS